MDNSWECIKRITDDHSGECEWVIYLHMVYRGSYLLNVLHVHRNNTIWFVLSSNRACQSCTKQLPDDLYFIAQMLKD